MPSFNIFGYTDLDILDLMTGAAERGLGIDVRENWNNCFKYISFADTFNRFLQTGVLGFVPLLLWNLTIGQEDHKDFDALVPPQCEQIANEFDDFSLWIRAQ